MKKKIWFFFIISLIFINTLSLTAINNHNLESQIFELNRFQSCKVLYLESMLTNVTSEYANSCAVSSLLNAKQESETYQLEKNFIPFFIFLAIASSVVLLILSIKHPFKNN